jgi:UDP-N-acetylmuramoylalanine--D-glutamate ligase
MAAELAGVSKKNIINVIKEFGGLEHRLELVGEKEGIRFINDSLSTIPEATIRALETFPDTETLIVGGYDRGLDFKKLGEYLSHTSVKTLILFPESGKRIWEEVYRVIPENKRPEKIDVTSMEQAVRIAFAETMPGRTCLLSPASASFGIFKNYKDRGEQFKKAIENF